MEFPGSWAQFGSILLDGADKPARAEKAETRGDRLSKSVSPKEVTARLALTSSLTAAWLSEIGKASEGARIERSAKVMVEETFMMVSTSNTGKLCVSISLDRWVQEWTLSGAMDGRYISWWDLVEIYVEKKVIA